VPRTPELRGAWPRARKATRSSRPGPAHAGANDHTQVHQSRTGGTARVHLATRAQVRRRCAGDDRSRQTYRPGSLRRTPPAWGYTPAPARRTRLRVAAAEARQPARCVALHQGPQGFVQHHRTLAGAGGRAGGLEQIVIDGHSSAHVVGSRLGLIKFTPNGASFDALFYALKRSKYLGSRP